MSIEAGARVPDRVRLILGLIAYLAIIGIVTYVMGAPA